MRPLQKIMATVQNRYRTGLPAILFALAMSAAGCNSSSQCTKDRDCFPDGFCRQRVCEPYHREDGGINFTNDGGMTTNNIPHEEEDTTTMENTRDGGRDAGRSHNSMPNIPAGSGKSGEWQECNGNETRPCGTCDYGLQHCVNNAWQACNFTPPQTGAQQCACSVVTSTTHPAGVLFILDASGSMAESYPGGRESKYVVARDAIETVLQRYQGQINFGLDIFGTDGCTTPNIHVSMGSNPSVIEQTLNAYGPSGGTPLASAITMGTSELQRYHLQHPADSIAAIILSDGGESCSGNPIAAVTEMIN